MSNFEIITTEAMAAGIYTKEQIEEMVKATGTIPLHTFAEWKRLGYKVKKGEHAKLACRIWKWNEKTETLPMTDGEDQEVDASHYYLAKAFFFTDEQVERIKPITA